MSSALPMRHSMLPDDCYEGMDPGIRFAVRVLHAYGIPTNESCEGGEDHSYDWPTVMFVGEPQTAGGFAALAALASYGLPVRSVAYEWSIRHGLPAGPGCWKVEFSRPLHDTADQRPMFVRHYQHRAEPATWEGAS